jgi:glycerol-1-phosphate dehydrogenase [NAD(P)+]
MKMVNFSNRSINDLLQPEGFPCICGKHHHAALHYLALGPGVLAQLPGMIRAVGSLKPFIVMDDNTRRAAGHSVCSMLAGERIPHTSFCFAQAHVEPDEYSVGQVVMAFDPSCDLILGIGSGSINDICKIVSNVSGKPLAIVATAPSMDGFASNTSSMISGGIKKTIYSTCPLAIIADTDILCQAPLRMLQAGLGDMLAKYVSICEWRISHLVNGEYYCESVAEMMRRATRKCVMAADGLARRDPLAVQAVVEGLILSGIAMSFAEVSRPASGLEHYFSHIWEMRALASHKPAELHGIQVGVGTLLTLKIYEWIHAVRPDRDHALDVVSRFDRTIWTADMRRIFGSSSDNLLAMETVSGIHDAQKHKARLEHILIHWPGILRIMEEELPSYLDILKLMQGIGEPALPSEIGITQAEVRDALIASMEIRDKYIGSRLLWDLGMLDEWAVRLQQFCTAAC